jgi:hypothetical protein
MANSILARVLTLVEEGLHPSVVWAEPIAPGRWLVRITLDDFVPPGEGVLSIDRKALPEGVSLSGFERHPDDETTLAHASDAVIETWMREVASAGKAPDMAKLGNRWLTKPIEWLREPMRTKLLEKYRGGKT